MADVYSQHHQQQLLQQQQLQQHLAMGAQQHQQQQQQQQQQQHTGADDGITGRRFEGRVEAFLEDKMFGFIRCEELRSGRFPDKDIFVHKRQLLHFQKGDRVSFSVSIGRQGKPQATDLGYPGAAAGIESSDPAYAMKAQQQQQQQPQQQQQQQHYHHQQHQQHQQSGYQQHQQTGYQVPPAHQQQQQHSYPAQESRAAPPRPLPPPQQEEWGVEEVDMPSDLAADLQSASSARAQEIVKLAGGEISIQFVSQGPTQTRAQIRGPKSSASLGACLILQHMMAAL